MMLSTYSGEWDTSTSGHVCIISQALRGISAAWTESSLALSNLTHSESGRHVALKGRCVLTVCFIVAVLRHTHTVQTLSKCSARRTHYSVFILVWKGKENITRAMAFLSVALQWRFPLWHNLVLMKYKGRVCLHSFVSIVQKQSLSGRLASLGNWSFASAASKLMKAVPWS